jgi:hypothetical protein
MTAWTRVTRGEVKPVGVVRGYVSIEIELRSTPPPGWATAFANPVGVEMSYGRNAPTISGSTIYLSLPPKEMETRVKEIDARIQHANDVYEQRVLPERQAAEAQKEQDRQADQALLDEAKALAKNL